MNIRYFRLFICLACVAFSYHAAAVELQVNLTIKNHRFEPVELKVPANQRVKLIVINHDDSAEEFESYSLNREKLVPANGKAVIFIGPLKPGRYDFLVNLISQQPKVLLWWSE